MLSEDFGASVDATLRLIENQDVRIDHEGARDAQLALATFNQVHIIVAPQIEELFG